MTEPKLDKHEEVAALIRDVDVRAPDELHARVAAMVSDASARPRRALGLRAASARLPLLTLRASGALVAAAVIAIVAIAATGGFGGSSGQPSLLSAAARLTLAPATAPAPPERPAGGGRLAAAVEGVAFPYWESALGWRATGMRTGTLDGRPTQAVFYTDGAGRRVGYTIVGGSSPPSPVGGREVWLQGTEYRVVRIGGVQAVVWLRDGRLCVVSGRGIAGSTLVHLASWGRPASVTTASPA